MLGFQTLDATDTNRQSTLGSEARDRRHEETPGFKRGGATPPAMITIDDISARESLQSS